MTTIAQSINERHLHDKSHKRSEERGSALDIVADIALFLATPVIGLVFAVLYGFFGLAVVFCYGLKAIGVQCGLFSE